MLEHRARGDFAEALTCQAESIHDAPERRRHHVDVAGFGVVGVLAREGYAGAADYGNTLEHGHGGSSVCSGWPLLPPTASTQSRWVILFRYAPADAGTGPSSPSHRLTGTNPHV